MFKLHESEFGAFSASVRCLANEAIALGDLVNIGTDATDALPYVEVIDNLTDVGMVGVALNAAAAKDDEVMVMLVTPGVHFRTTAYTGTTNKPKIMATYPVRIASMNIDADESTHNYLLNYIRGTVIKRIPATESESGVQEYVVILHPAWTDAVV